MVYTECLFECYYITAMPIVVAENRVYLEFVQALSWDSLRVSTHGSLGAFSTSTKPLIDPVILLNPGCTG